VFLELKRGKYDLPRRKRALDAVVEGSKFVRVQMISWNLNYRSLMNTSACQHMCKSFETYYDLHI
jgi:hypothetical protein